MSTRNIHVNTASYTLLVAGKKKNTGEEWDVLEFSSLTELKKYRKSRHCCKVSDEAAFCLIQRPYISKTLLTRRISPRGSP